MHVGIKNLNSSSRTIYYFPITLLIFVRKVELDYLLRVQKDESMTIIVGISLLLEILIYKSVSLIDFVLWISLKHCVFCFSFELLKLLSLFPIFLQRWTSFDIWKKVKFTGEWHFWLLLRVSFPLAVWQLTLWLKSLTWKDFLIKF